ncbi:MAG TPA: hypothetical protein VJT81_09675 [Burkholderiales bacterium]|nr:hypothetical protein [Burkholderiales bacterium]
MRHSIQGAFCCGHGVRFKSFRLIFCAALIAPLIGPAGANMIVLDFEQTGCCTSADYFENGVRVTPNYHYDFVPSLGGVPTGRGFEGFEGSTYIGVDRSGALGDAVNSGLVNPAFPAAAYQAGPNVWPALWIDVGGQPFSILDFWVTRSPWELHSSSGGLLTSIDFTSPGTISVSGAEWQNIEWVLWVALHDAGAPDIGIDHLRLDVPTSIPEPKTCALILTSLGVLGLVMNRKKRLEGRAAT